MFATEANPHHIQHVRWPSHSTRTMAAINIRAIDVYDVTKWLCEGHVSFSSHVSHAYHDVTTVHHSTIKNLVHIKAPRFTIRWTKLSTVSALQPLPSNIKQNKSEEEGKKALQTVSVEVNRNTTKPHPIRPTDSAKLHRTNVRSLSQGTTVSEALGRHPANQQQMPLHDLLVTRGSTAPSASATMTPSASQPNNTLQGSSLSLWIPSVRPMFRIHVIVI